MTRSPALAPVVVGLSLCGTDSALVAGARAARRTGRPLDLVHVAPYDDREASLRADRLHAAAARARVLAGPACVVHTELLGGEVVPALLHAGRAGALLVTGRSPDHRPGVAGGRAALERFGGQGLLVPDDWLEDRHGVVTVGVDPGEDDDPTLSAALAEARRRTAALRVLVTTASGQDRSRVRGRVEARLDSLGGDACDVALEVVAVPAAPALVEASATSDLVVLGRHHLRVEHHVLRSAACPVLLTPSLPVHPAGTGATEPRGSTMYARPGDRIVVRGIKLGAPIRDGEIIEVEHADGSPPYRVRWSDDGHESLFFPGPDARIDREGPSYPPEYDVAASAG